MKRTRTIAAGLAAALATLAVAGPAAAHVQISPTVAAPDDAVLFQFLVPNERSQRTVEVAVRIPDGVLPFSFEDTPGWTRTEEQAPNGAVAVVRWRGRLAPDGFARFAFLASTPPRAGTIAWKATQTYGDGEVVRWIGAPDSDFPAAVTTISASAVRQNAGGESAEGAAPAAGTTAPSSTAPARAATTTTEDTGRDVLTLVLAAAAFVLALGGLLVALVRTRPGRAGRT